MPHTTALAVVIFCVLFLNSAAQRGEKVSSCSFPGVTCKTCVFRYETGITYAIHTAAGADPGLQTLPILLPPPAAASLTTTGYPKLSFAVLARLTSKALASLFWRLKPLWELS
jgi:hypothetical protein